MRRELLLLLLLRLRLRLLLEATTEESKANLHVITETMGHR